MPTCDVDTIDSNDAGLAFAEEECKSQLPIDPIWYILEPNSFGDSGADIKTVARKPLNALRKNKKGSVVGLSATMAFNQDLTQNNSTRLFQTFFFAAARQKPSTQPLNGTAVTLTSAATADDSYNAASGLDRFLAGHLIKVTGFANGANNVFTRVATKATGKITVDANLVDDGAPSIDTKIDVVGFQFGSGALAMVVDAALVTLSLTGIVKASGTYTLSATNQPADADTVTIGSKVYTFKTTLSTNPTVANEVLRGANQAASLANLAAAINGTTGLGSTYSVGTVANTQVTAAVAGATVVVTAIVGGASGNAIATTEVGANSSWGAATLASGAGLGFVELGLIPGEWIGVGGDTTSLRYVVSTNTAFYGRLHTVTDSAITLNDTTGVVNQVTDPGTGKTIQIFFGTVLRDEDVKALIVKRYVQFETTYGEDAAGPQAEYETGSIGNELNVAIPTEDKIAMDLSFLSSDVETRIGTEGLKPGLRVNAPGEAAYNTSSDVYRIRMNILDSATLNPTAMFGWVESGSIKITNGAAAVKAVGRRSSLGVSVGNFGAGGEVTAFFTEISAVRAARNNSDVAISMIIAQSNRGMVWDMPLISLSGVRPKIEADKPITLPITMEGAESVYGHQLLHVNFPYLPTVLMPTPA